MFVSKKSKNPGTKLHTLLLYPRVIFHELPAILPVHSATASVSSGRPHTLLLVDLLAARRHVHSDSEHWVSFGRAHVISATSVSVFHLLLAGSSRRDAIRTRLNWRRTSTFCCLCGSVPHLAFYWHILPYYRHLGTLACDRICWWYREDKYRVSQKRRFST